MAIRHPRTVFADDLSGAAEAAAALGAGVRVLLNARDATGEHPAPIVIDLDTRALCAAEAHDVAAAAWAAGRRAPVVVKKVDSLLRGRIAAELGPLLAPETVVVVCVALPDHGRTCVDGVVHLDGAPLHLTDAWAVEATPAPTSVAAVLTPHEVVELPLSVVREAGLPRVLDAHRGRIVVCDATTTDDIETIVAAAVAASPCVLVGTSAVCRALADPVVALPAQAPTPRTTRCLTAIGSASPVAAAQAAHLAGATGAPILTPAADQLRDADAATLHGWSARLAALLDEGDAIVRVGEPADRPLGPGDGVRVTEQLARIVADVVAAASTATGLILTGGETARAVLNALGVRYLDVVAEVKPGAILCRASDGRLVATKPGSFGTADTLTLLHAAMTNAEPEEGNPDMTTSARPIIAVTMGDGAGVGPEVTVAALCDAEVRAACLPVVIGDARRLEQAADVLGLNPEIVAIAGIEDAVDAPGRINVIDLGLLPEDLPWGELSAVAGDAAYQYIKVAAELAVTGAVQAICTAPLNKEALHLGGHPFPGHTEMLAHLTGTPEVSMMLSSPKLRVIHVTTHIGLIDAINKIEPDLVERVVRRGWEALRRAGIADPRVGVCAINPHAGEGGLFGYGEEETKIIPALVKLRAEGLRVEGPLPADTAFYLAGRGDYDLIVAMYHDQGHGPVKVLGIEDGVNITVGLPVIRTSVDHGTAFDIAGKGVVKSESMVEAMRQAVALAATR